MNHTPQVSVFIRRHLLRMAWLVLLMVGVTSMGMAGYHYLMGWSWLESLYMTLITLTTVGYGETHELTQAGRIFTMVLLLSSVGFIAYSLSSVTSMVMDQGFHRALRIRRMENKIQSLRDHYIICGYGRTGRQVVRHLQLSYYQLVVIEGQAERTTLLREQELLHIDGDATHDETLMRAGILHARGLVAALGNDAENVYLVLSARQLNPALSIVSWATDEESGHKVRRAGADHVLSPYLLGGRRIAQLLTVPNAMAFLDNVMGEDENIRLGEIAIHAGSNIAGKRLKEAGISRQIGVILIGIRRVTGELVFNPSGDTVLEERDVMIGIGTPDQIRRLQSLV